MATKNFVPLHLIGKLQDAKAANFALAANPESVFALYYGSSAKNEFTITELLDTLNADERGYSDVSKAAYANLTIHIWNNYSEKLISALEDPLLFEKCWDALVKVADQGVPTRHIFLRVSEPKLFAQQKFREKLKAELTGTPQSANSTRIVNTAMTDKKFVKNTLRWAYSLELMNNKNLNTENISLGQLDTLGASQKILNDIASGAISEKGVLSYLSWANSPRRIFDRITFAILRAARFDQSNSPYPPGKEFKRQIAEALDAKKEKSNQQAAKKNNESHQKVPDAPAGQSAPNLSLSVKSSATVVSKNKTSIKLTSKEKIEFSVYLQQTKEFISKQAISFFKNEMVSNLFNNTVTALAVLINPLRAMHSASMIKKLERKTATRVDQKQEVKPTSKLQTEIESTTHEANLESSFASEEMTKNFPLLPMLSPIKKVLSPRSSSSSDILGRSFNSESSSTSDALGRSFNSETSNSSENLGRSFNSESSNALDVLGRSFNSEATNTSEILGRSFASESSAMSEDLGRSFFESASTSAASDSERSSQPANNSFFDDPFSMRSYVESKITTTSGELCVRHNPETGQIRFLHPVTNELLYSGKCDIDTKSIVVLKHADQTYHVGTYEIKGTEIVFDMETLEQVPYGSSIRVKEYDGEVSLLPVSSIPSSSAMSVESLTQSPLTNFKTISMKMDSPIPASPKKPTADKSSKQSPSLRKPLVNRNLMTQFNDTDQGCRMSENRYTQSHNKTEDASQNNINVVSPAAVSV